MDSEQFKQYTDSVTVMESTKTLHRRHAQCIQSLIRQTKQCERTSTAFVRAWFKDNELAGGEVGVENQIEIATRTAAGLLYCELERYVTGVLATNNSIKNRFNATWVDVRAHLRTAFPQVMRAVPSEMRSRKETKSL